MTEKESKTVLPSGRKLTDAEMVALMKRHFRSEDGQMVLDIMQHWARSIPMSYARVQPALGMYHWGFQDLINKITRARNGYL